MLATLDGAEEHTDPEPEDDQVEDHLRGDEEAARLASGGDVAEADRGEDETVTVKYSESVRVSGYTFRAWRKVVLPGQWVCLGHRGRSRGDELSVEPRKIFSRHLADQQRCRTRQLATAGYTS